MSRCANHPERANYLKAVLILYYMTTEKHQSIVPPKANGRGVRRPLQQRQQRAAPLL